MKAILILVGTAIGATPLSSAIASWVGAVRGVLATAGPEPACLAVLGFALVAVGIAPGAWRRLHPGTDRDGAVLPSRCAPGVVGE